MDETHLIDIQRKEINGEYIYFDLQGNFFDNKGEVINKVKFESCIDGKYQLINKEEKEQVKEQKEQKNLQTMPLSEKMLAETKEYTQKLIEMILEKYEGQTVGEGDFTLVSLMHEFFDAPPGEKQEKKGKKAKKKKETSGEPKKPRALSGYTLFAKDNKETFNKEMSELDEKPKYVSFVSGKWKGLSDDEKGEWNQKAKDLKDQA